MKKQSLVDKIQNLSTPKIFKEGAKMLNIVFAAVIIIAIYLIQVWFYCIALFDSKKDIFDGIILILIMDLCLIFLVNFLFIKSKEIGLW